MLAIVCRWRKTTYVAKRMECVSRAGGIDWWRFGKEFLMKMLVHFAKLFKYTRPPTIVYLDKALSHAHKLSRIFSISQMS